MYRLTLRVGGEPTDGPEVTGDTERAPGLKARKRQSTEQVRGFSEGSGHQVTGCVSGPGHQGALGGAFRGWLGDGSWDSGAAWWPLLVAPSCDLPPQGHTQPRPSEPTGHPQAQGPEPMPRDGWEGVI